MKNKFYVGLITSIFATGIFAVTNVAEAYPRNCQWVSAHRTVHGRFVPAHRVCSYNRGYRGYRCTLVGGHTRHGVWYPAHKVCRNYR